MGAKGKTPWMTLNGTDMADSQMCIEHLCEKVEGADTERDLGEEQKAISRATRIMLEVRNRLFYENQILQNLPLTSKLKFRFGLARSGQARPKQNFCFETT